MISLESRCWPNPRAMLEEYLSKSTNTNKQLGVHLAVATKYRHPPEYIDNEEEACTQRTMVMTSPRAGYLTVLRLGLVSSPSVVFSEGSLLQLRARIS